MGNVVLDAFLDTLKLFPFFLLLYILIELMEHNTKMGKPRPAFAGKWAPVLGTLTGIVPMCGFSVMAAKLWQRRHLSLGTLVAVFIATSDEALIVLLLAKGTGFGVNDLIGIAALVGCKIVLGIAAGYFLDLLSKRKPAPIPAPSDGDDHDGENHDHDHAHEDHDHGNCACGELSSCEHKKKSAVSLYFVSPLLHALKVALFVFLVNLLFGLLFYWLGGGDAGAGADVLGNFMKGAGYWFQPLVCAALGAIPNCASSVVLAQTYALGGIGFGGLLAGLVVNAGLGYLVLFKRETWKKGLLILAGMLAFGVAVGYCANAVGLCFI